MSSDRAVKKVAVIGLGAIGGLVAGYLKAKAVEVVAVGRREQKKEIEDNGLVIDGVRGRSMVYVDVLPRLEEAVDLAIITVKTQDLKDAIDVSRPFLKDALILSTQNGVRADKLLGMMLGEERIVSSIVMFGSTYEPYHKIIHNFEGKWLIGRPFGPNDEEVNRIVELLGGVFEALAVDNIMGMKWLKIFVNFSNCLPALLGKSMQETYADLNMCRLSLEMLQEGFEVADRLGIELKDMPDFEIEKLRGLARMPLEQGVPVYSKIMTNLSQEPLFGSVLQSIQRGKSTEIDYLNGEVANQAKLRGLSAPLNTRATELIHFVENKKRFLSSQELLARIREAD